MPDGIQLVGIQRRIAVFREFDKAIVGFIGVAVAFQDSSGVVGHGSVPGAFRYGDAAVGAAVHVLIKLIVQK